MVRRQWAVEVTSPGYGRKRECAGAAEEHKQLSHREHPLRFDGESQNASAGHFDYFLSCGYVAGETATCASW